MQLLSYDEILTNICDSFDALIAPRAITRANTNIIYLIFKAVAKGYEVINNTVVALSNKFNPENCSVEDLDSVASMVGTERLQGSASGLHIIITNNSNVKVTIFAGLYYYAFEEDIIFYFEILENTEIEAGNYITVIAMSEKTGSYVVTSQDSITVTSDLIIPEGVTFSCNSNENLLGTEPETNLEFRKRILNGVNNQDTIIELENTIKNLPYIFDCKCKFNQTASSVTYDGYTIPPYNLAIFYSGMARNELAEIVASKTFFPTLESENSVKVYYKNEVFTNGQYEVNLIPFKELLFSVKIIWEINKQYADTESAKAKVRTALNKVFAGTTHKDYIKEDDIYNTIETIDITGISILGVDLIYNSQTVNYILVPVSRIPKIDTVSFEESEVNV